MRVVQMHKFTLANGGTGLRAGDVERLFAQTDLSHPDGDCAGGDENQMRAGVLQIGQNFDQFFKAAYINRLIRVSGSMFRSL